MYESPTTFDTSLFQGAAKFYLTSDGFRKLKELAGDDLATQIFREDCLDLDLIISDVGYTYSDHAQIEEHLGDICSAHFYGKAPIVLNIQAQLVNTSVNQAKWTLNWVYRNIFRLSSVARHRIVPLLEFVGCTVQGAMLSMRVTESSSRADALSVAFEFLVFNLYHMSPDNLSGKTQSMVLFNSGSNIMDQIG